MGIVRDLRIKNKFVYCRKTLVVHRYTQVVYNNPAVHSDEKGASSKILGKGNGDNKRERERERDIKSRHYVESGGGDV